MVKTFQTERGNTIKKDFGPIIASKPENSSEFKFASEGRQPIVLKQKVVTTSSFTPIASSGGLFAPEEFINSGAKEYINSRESVRVAFIQAPSNLSIKEIQARIDSNPEAMLYMVRSNRPILDEAQNAIHTKQQESGITTLLDSKAKSQILRNKDTGMLSLDNNLKPIYRQCFLAKEYIQDKDMTTRDSEDFYLSEELRSEYHSVISGGAPIEYQYNPEVSDTQQA